MPFINSLIYFIKSEFSDVFQSVLLALNILFPANTSGVLKIFVVSDIFNIFFKTEEEWRKEKTLQKSLVP